MAEHIGNLIVGGNLALLWNKVTPHAKCVPIIKVPAANSSKGQRTHVTLVFERKRGAGERDWMKPEQPVADFFEEQRGGAQPWLVSVM